MSHVYRVVASPVLIPDDRDFGVKIVKLDGEEVLLVPCQFLPIMVERRIETSDLFYALVYTDPRSIEKILKWDHRQIVKSLQGLRVILGLRE